MNVITLPKTNPIQLLHVGSGTYWQDTRPYFEFPAEYFNKWQQGDIIRFEVTQNIALLPTLQLTAKLISCTTGLSAGMFNGSIVFATSSHVTLVYELQLPAVTGDYYVKMYDFNGSQNYTFYSEAINIKAVQRGTSLLKYYSDGIIHDTYWQYSDGSQVEFYFRCPGGFQSKDFAPSGVNNIFADQTNSYTLLSSIPFNTKKFTVGSNKGVPNYIADLVNRIFSCESVYIDTVQYCKVEGATLEQVEYGDKHVTGVWKINLSEAPNEYSNYTGLGVGDIINNEVEIFEGDQDITESFDGKLIIDLSSVNAEILYAVVYPTDYSNATNVIHIEMNGNNATLNIGDVPPGNYSYVIFHS